MPLQDHEDLEELGFDSSRPNRQVASSPQWDSRPAFLVSVLWAASRLYHNLTLLRIRFRFA